ncbi:MAG: choice-of-anchor D domain-containing protein [Ignavibacteria bacterium]|nr:choice-of-anchor D domain-containing protein [Ignavibacteria bacterium]
MRTVCGLILSFFITTILFSQSYHSINIDGNNDFTTPETFTTSSNGYTSYITWDETYLYLGYTGGDVGSGQSNDKWIVFYLDTDPQLNIDAGNGTRTAIGFTTQNWNFPFKADYMLQIQTTSGYNALQFYDGSNWEVITPHNMTIYDNNETNFIEIKIERSKLNSPKHIKMVSYFLNEGTGPWTYAINPSDALSDGNYTVSAGDFTSYYYYYLYDSIQPNSTYHKNNYSWLVKLNATVNSKSATSYAGMASNATNGLDAGIDLPKPPTPVSDYIEIYFPHSSWTSNLGNNYLRDFRALSDLSSTTETWDFTINTDRTNSEVTLSASLFDFVPSNYNIKIKDISADSVHNIKLSNYVYNSGVGGTKNFQLIIGVALSEPNISANSSNLNFGTLKTNQDSTIVLVVTNSGQLALDITNIVPTGDFYSYNGPTSNTLSENDTMQIPIKFAPRAAGTFPGSIAISSNDPDTPVLTVSLNGDGVLLTPNISSFTSSLSFGNIKVGNDSTISFYVSNKGDTTLTVNGLNFNNAVFSSVTSIPFNVAVNDSTQLSVKFTPTSAQTFSGSLKIFSNDADTLSLTLSGTGYVLTPDISASLASLSFGTVKVDYDSSLSFKIYNTGDTTLAVSNIVVSNNVFSVTSGATYNVSINDSATITVTFRPLNAEGYTATMKFISNDVDTLSIDLNGTGIAATLTKIFTSGWNLMSVPVQPENNLTSVVLGDDLDLFFLYNYSSSAGYQTSNTIDAGNGYWLGIESLDTVDVTGSAITSNQTKSLSPGWNLVASPFVRTYLKSLVYFTDGTSTLSPLSAIDSGWIQNNYYGYDGTSYSSKDTLSQWFGYWLLTLKSGISSIFYHDSTSGSPANKIRLEETESEINNWSVPIFASINGITDNLLSFGVNVDATDGFDVKFDLAKPPVSPSPNSVETYFENQGWSSFITKFAADIKAPMSNPLSGKSWAFKVMSKNAGTVLLNWDNILSNIPESVRNEYRFNLTGSTVTGNINMLTVFNHSFTAIAGQIYSFQINASPTDVKEELNNFTFELKQNYPNPFNPSTVINYQLENSGRVSLRVYDILGTEVATLVDEEKEAGIYNADFDASKLSSGVYFYKLQSGKFVQTRKMILIR